MSVRTQNWMKFGSLVILAFTLGLLFAGLLDLPTRSSAQQSTGSTAAITRVQAPDIPAARPLVELSDAFAAELRDAADVTDFGLVQHLRKVTVTSAKERVLEIGLDELTLAWRGTLDW